MPYFPLLQLMRLSISGRLYSSALESAHTHRLAVPVLAKERISNQALHFSTGMTSSICENTASHSLEAAIHLEASCNSLTTAVSTKRLAKNLHGIYWLHAGQCETLA